MRKIYVILGFCLLVAAAASAQTNNSPLQEEPDPTQIELIQENIQDGIATLEIRYFPVTKEAEFTYSCRSSLFDEGVAINTIRERANRFINDKGFVRWTHRPDTKKQDDKSGKTTSFTMYITVFGPRK